VRSPTGRTRTAPARDADVRRIRFGVVSRANLQAGLFSAYRHLTKRDDIDAVLHLGDYLYEYAPGEYGVGQGEADVREHVPAREVVSLSDYRQRHAQYKADPDLAALHASAAWPQPAPASCCPARPAHRGPRPQPPGASMCS
jgi:alkaline phosphatase D